MTMTERSLETIDTPSLLIDRDRLERNLRRMQEKADRFGVKLRPHTKTHRCPALARRQEELGAAGITVAKLGEAEVMAREGLTDIFIANEIVGPIKLRRLRALAETGIRLAVGADNSVHVDILSQAFRDSGVRLDVLVDVDTGDPRTGVTPGDGVLARSDAVDGVEASGEHQPLEHGSRDPGAVEEVGERGVGAALAGLDHPRHLGVADPLHVGEAEPDRVAATGRVALDDIGRGAGVEASRPGLPVATKSRRGRLGVRSGRRRPARNRPCSPSRGTQYPA